MKYIWILLVGTLLFAACSDNEELIDDQVEVCDIVLGWEEINLFYECDRIDDVAEAKSVLVGDWKLKAWDCGFCDPSQVDTPSIDVVLLENGEGTSMYQGVGSDDFEFTWTVERDTFGNTFLRTEPRVWHVTGSLICPNYFGNSNSALDGPTYVYSKCN